MVIAASFEDVKATNTRHRERENGAIVDSTNLFGGRSAPDIAHAKLSTHSPGWITSSHFHEIDQFQIIFGGRCKFGRHDVNPYCVHFSRAYTPYGPLVPNLESGFSFMVLRTRFDAGAQKMPDSADKLKQVSDRQPWQVTRRVSFPQLQHGADALLQEDPEIKDDHGLATYTLSMKPNARFTAPDPAASNGQYVIATKGSLRHDNKEFKAPAALFVSPQESAYEIAAGGEGLEALVLHFPRDYAAPAKAKAHSNGLKTWQCALCSFVYDEAAGLPHEGIAPGTRWQDVPDTWSCPDCAASKRDFQMQEI